MNSSKQVSKSNKVPLAVGCRPDEALPNSGGRHPVAGTRHPLIGPSAATAGINPVGAPTGRMP